MTMDINIGNKVAISGSTYQVTAINGRSVLFSKDGRHTAFRLTHGEVKTMIGEKKITRIG